MLFSGYSYTKKYEAPDSMEMFPATSVAVTASFQVCAANTAYICIQIICSNIKSHRVVSSDLFHFRVCDSYRFTVLTSYHILTYVAFARCRR